MKKNLLTKAKNLLPQLRELSPVAFDICSAIIKTLDSYSAPEDAAINWTSRKFVATDFTASAGTWTVQSTDVEAINSRFIDDYTLFLNFLIGAATVTSTTPAYLKYNLLNATIRLPFFAVCEILVGGAREFGSFQGVVGETFIRIYRQGEVAWTASADIEIKGQAIIPVYTRNS